MKCDKCGNEVFDVYTTENRIKQLYKIHTRSCWARRKLGIILEMLDENEKHISDRISLKWLREELIKVREHIGTLEDS